MKLKNIHRIIRKNKEFIWCCKMSTLSWFHIETPPSTTKWAICTFNNSWSSTWQREQGQKMHIIMHKTLHQNAWILKCQYNNITAKTINPIYGTCNLHGETGWNVIRYGVENHSLIPLRDFSVHSSGFYGHYNNHGVLSIHSIIQYIISWTIIFCN